MKKIAALVIGVVFLAVFIMPDTQSMFAGMHTFYGGNCIKCHFNEYNELMASQSSVLNAHLRAANNTNYTTYLSVGGIAYNYTHIATNYDGDGDGVNDTWVWNGGLWRRTSDNTTLLFSLDTDSTTGISGNEACQLCHNASLFGFTGSHVAVVRTCDDDRCHGNSNHTYNDPRLFENATRNTTDAGALISENNVHSPFYQHLRNQSTSYLAGTPFNHTLGNAVGDRLSRGYYSCVACHSSASADTSFEQTHYTHANKTTTKQKYI